MITAGGDGHSASLLAAAKREGGKIPTVRRGSLGKIREKARECTPEFRVRHLGFHQAKERTLPGRGSIEEAAWRMGRGRRAPPTPARHQRGALSPRCGRRAAVASGGKGTEGEDGKGGGGGRPPPPPCSAPASCRPRGALSPRCGCRAAAASGAKGEEEVARHHRPPQPRRRLP